MKKFISILITTILTASIFVVPGGAVYAAESRDVQVVVNPAYEDVVTEEQIQEFKGSISEKDKFAPKGSSDQYIDSISEAGILLREEMIKRTSELCIKFETTADKDAMSIADEIYYEAVKHTGTPQEGDYLKFAAYMRGTSVSYYTLGNKRYIDIDYSFNFNASAQQEAQVSSRINELRNELDLDNASDYEKISGIYKYITHNVEYSYEFLEDQSDVTKLSAYGALIDGSSVCQGYAQLFYRLALEYGVDTRMISGLGNGGAHAWNIVKLGDKYYNLDSTWDAYPDFPYRYFLKGSEAFDGKHVRDDEYLTQEFNDKYPTSSADFTESDIEEPEPPTEPDEPETPGDAGPQECTHDWVYYKEVPATCYSEGTAAGRCCPLCSGEEGFETLPKLKHTPQVASWSSRAGIDESGFIYIECSECKECIDEYYVTAIDEVKLLKSAYTYDGKIKTPDVSVTDYNGNKLVENDDYIVEYPEGRKNVGKYTVEVIFKGDYEGSELLTFKINPKATSIRTLKAGDNRFTVKWYKRYPQATGYQIRYSTSSKFKSYKQKTVSSYKTTYKTYKGLKNKKRYYVRIRTYKVVNGAKYYSAWSKTKSVRTK